MNRRARILCAFGSIEVLVSFIVLFIFEHTPYPWGAATMGGGLATDAAIERTMMWQARALTSIVGAAIVGIAFLLAACAMFLISKFKSRAIH